MKISKLFHWLYAFLMLLPIFAVGVKCGYVIFNKNAKDSYLGSFDYQTNASLSSILNGDTTFISYVVNDNTIYKVNNPYLSNTYNGSFHGGIFQNINSSIWVINFSYLKVNSTEFYNGCFFIGPTNQAGNYLALKVYDFTFNNTFYFTRDGLFDSNGLSVSPIRAFYSTNNSTFIYLTFTLVDLFKIEESTLMYGSYTTNLFISDTTLSSVFYSALDELDNVEFFSWAKDSFLAEPFMYIGNLFGIPNVHPIFTFLSYWMSISVIWLVFDLFMYVPLLVHRWLDKGVIE